MQSNLRFLVSTKADAYTTSYNPSYSTTTTLRYASPFPIASPFQLRYVLKEAAGHTVSFIGQT